MIGYFIKFSNEYFYNSQINYFSLMHTSCFIPLKNMDRSLRISFAFANAFNTLTFNKIKA